MIKFGKDFARNPILQKSSPAVTPVLPLSSAVLVWFVKNKTERNSSQSKVTIVYSKATSPYQFLNSSNCTISIIALLKGSLKDRIPLRGLFFPINTTALLLAGFFKCYPRLPVHVKPKSNYTRAFICTRKCKLLFSLCTISTTFIE